MSATDTRDLRIVSVANYVVAGAALLNSGLMLLLGIAGTLGFAGQNDTLAAVLVAVMFVIGVGLLWVAAATHVLVGYNAYRRRAHKFCFFAAIATAAMPTCFPLALATGCFTAIVLGRPTVMAAFGVGR